ncbi:hypothetical protein VZT92_026752 [Zoarces viviparus]|uniref:Uncharacterized protein n=1 Tax=Zoarces viviparus TaxID=48416 RepID=A0AAW1DSC1_ZOAVI
MSIMKNPASVHEPGLKLFKSKHPQRLMLHGAIVRQVTRAGPLGRLDQHCYKDVNNKAGSRMCFVKASTEQIDAQIC